jgi:iron-sulfur cluster repair protein YtfE (RIC family)
MAGPLGAVKFIHNAIRQDIKNIKGDVSTVATLGAGSLEDAAKRFAFLEEVLGIHERAEEAHVFPAISAKVPGTGEHYERTHREIDAIRASLRAALAANNAEDANARLTDLRDRMGTHLDEEETVLLPLVDEHFSIPEQGAIVGRMAGETPTERMGEVLTWILRLVNNDDRAAYLGVLSKATPPEAFAGVKALAAKVIPPADWQALTAKVPELA